MPTPIMMLAADSKKWLLLELFIELDPPLSLVQRAPPPPLLRSPPDDDQLVPLPLAPRSLLLHVLPRPPIQL